MLIRLSCTQHSIALDVKMFQCDKCSKSYKQRKDLVRHQREKQAPGGGGHICPNCGAKYSWDKDLKEHLKKGALINTNSPLP